MSGLAQGGERMNGASSGDVERTPIGASSRSAVAVRRGAGKRSQVNQLGYM